LRLRASILLSRHLLLSLPPSLPPSLPLTTRESPKYECPISCTLIEFISSPSSFTVGLGREGGREGGVSGVDYKHMMDLIFLSSVASFLPPFSVQRISSTSQ